ncbi:MAG: hypothetical protein ACK4R6_03520 [Spirosomataceae bacterium]
MSSEEPIDQGKKWKEIVWTGFFALMYPIITLFSLLFTGILTVFSSLSRLIVYLVGKLLNKK